jgi:hypothetical protein
MFVIVVGVAGVTATMWWATKRSDSGKVMSEASNVARFISETVRTQGFLQQTVLPDSNSGLKDNPTDRRDIYAPPLSASLLGMGHVTGQTIDSENIQSDVDRFQRNVTYQQLPASGSQHAGNMALLSVRVYWAEKGFERHVIVESLLPLATP